MSSEKEQLEAAIEGLEGQRAILGSVVVDPALAAMRARLAALERPADEPAQTLKQVTILFLDVVGSTSLSQTLDPEEIHAVMDGAMARGTQIVRSRHGRVLQYAGDSLLAAFGADEAHEDDAEHAVRCGLALLDLGRTLAGEVQAAHGHAGVDVRVGAHTGNVLLGGGVDGEGTIRGMAVNIAARMEQTAPAGTLRISHDTYAQVRGLFEVDAQAPLQIKGVDGPVLSYLVTGAKPRSFRIGTRGIEGVATRMVGRDAELDALQQAFRRLFAERRFAAVTVVGEAGMGKSRLLFEFEAWSEARPELFYIFRGRATPHTQSQPFGLLRDILAWRFQIADDDSIEAARQKLEAGITPLFEPDDGAELAEGHAHVLGHLIGIEYRGSRHVKGILDDPRQIRNRALHVAAQLVRRISASDGAPVVLQLEDLHWADNESLDFLDYLAEVDRDVPLLILSSARPTLFERREDWGSTEGIHQRIELAPLDKTCSRMLADELLKSLPEVPAALREIVTGGSEGNPFYMEELVKMLIDVGAIQTGAQAWVLHADKLAAVHVPATLTGVLQARLDGLPVSEHHTLQVASVIGQVFWDQALQALDTPATQTLPALVRRDLTLPRGDAAADGLREYAFKHHILHQVTYGTVLKRTRRELHGQLAHWLSRLSGARANDFLGITAEHYEQAGDTANAAEYHARAAEHAGSRLAHDAVLTHVQRALALLGPQRADAGNAAHDASLRWRLLLVREASLSLQGRRAEQLADLDAMQALADALGDDRWRAHVAHQRSHMAMRTADWVLQESEARRGASLAERAGDGELRLRCLRLLALALGDQGDWRAGKALAYNALAQAHGLGLRKVEAACLNALAIITGDAEGDLVAALALNQQALAIRREIGDRRGEGIDLSNLGDLRLKLGALSQARDDLEGSLQMVRACGDRAMECGILSGLSALALWQGDDVRALSQACASRDMAVAMQARDMEALALIYQGHAELALGRHASAAGAFEQAHRVAQAIEIAWRHDATTGLARVALAQGDHDAALRWVEALLGHTEAGGTFDGVELARLLELTCYQVLSRCGDARAPDWLERGHAHLQATAASISDATLRQDFLCNIRPHRDIAAEWAARQASGS